MLVTDIIHLVKDEKCEEWYGKGKHMVLSGLKNLFPKQAFLSISDCFTDTEI